MMTRIPPTEVKGPLGFVVKAVSKRMLGRTPESIGVMWHHLPALRASSTYGRKVQGWHELAPDLKAYAHLAVAAHVGCSFCLDLNAFLAGKEGLDMAKVREVPRWQASDAFTPLERDVMAYAVAMSETPVQVTDELAARLLDQLGAPAMVELTTVVGFANATTRGNVAMGIESEGFCELPVAVPA